MLRIGKKKSKIIKIREESMNNFVDKYMEQYLQSGMIQERAATVELLKSIRFDLEVQGIREDGELDLPPEAKLILQTLDAVIVNIAKQPNTYVIAKP